MVPTSTAVAQARQEQTSPEREQEESLQVFSLCLTFKTSFPKFLSVRHDYFFCNTAAEYLFTVHCKNVFFSFCFLYTKSRFFFSHLSLQ